jgi:hypothetical protein
MNENVYGFNNIKIGSYDELLSYVSEEDIMTHYFGEWEPDKHYIDEHFKTENSPSFYISYYNQRLKWRRFGIYNTPKDPVEFVMFKHGLNFYDALNKIYNEVYLGETLLLDNQQLNGIRSKAKDQVNMAIVVKDWEDYDLDYWLQHDGMSVEQIESFYVDPASEYWANDKRVHISSAGDPLYCYNHSHETGRDSFTAYRPYADMEHNKMRRKGYYKTISFKFRKYMIRDHIMNLKSLLARKQNNGITSKLIVPRDPLLKDVCMLTSSLKDIMAFDTIGLDSCAPHTEEGVITEDLLITLKKHYPHVYVAYNNDETGVRQSIKITSNYKKYNLGYWNVPKTCNKCKDPAEVLKNQDKETLRETVYEKLKRDKVLV